MQNILTSNYQAHNRLKSRGREMFHISGNEAEADTSQEVSMNKSAAFRRTDNRKPNVL